MKRALLTLVAILAVPSLASADAIHFGGVGKSQVVTISGLGSVYAGELKWTGLNTGFYSYCVDLWNYLQPTEQVTVGTTDQMSAPGTDGNKKAAWLFNKYAETIHGSSARDSGAMAAGLQLALWEVVADSTANLSSGSFAVSWASTQALGYANQYLTALFAPNSGYQTATSTWLDVQRGTSGQDQIARVPEPATLALLGVGLFGVATRIRRRTVKA